MPVEQNFRDIDEYIASVPEDAAAALTQIRQLVHELVPGVAERISYHIPMFELNGRLLTYMAAYKQHIGMYGIAGIIDEFGERIAAYVNDKGTLRFPLKQPMPLDLIGDIVRFSMQNVLAKPARKR
ncbi:MAG: iron chaperone [Dehalococcoidia bacterium]